MATSDSLAAPPKHVPILVSPIVEALVGGLRGIHQQRIREGISSEQPNHSLLVADCTFGGGGHTAALLEAIRDDRELRGLSIRIEAMDRDVDAIEAGKVRFERAITEGRLSLRHQSFGELAKVQPRQRYAGLLADFGFSSDQIESSERGLSFLREGPVDMRLDRTQPTTAMTLLESLTERELADLIWELGEDRNSRRIASLLVKARSEEGLPTTTTELAALIGRAFPPHARFGRIHPATRTFQALRIAVNQELEQIDELLAAVGAALMVGARAAFLTFHSLEDRKVKLGFKGLDSMRPINKKPIVADEAEVAANSRSRSAKLRIFERV